jgi:hypothetical protein
MREIAMNLETQKRNASRSLPVSSQVEPIVSHVTFVKMATMEGNPNDLIKDIAVE